MQSRVIAGRSHPANHAERTAGEFEQGLEQPIEHGIGCAVLDEARLCRSERGQHPIRAFERALLADAVANVTANPADGDPHYDVTLGVAMLVGRFLMIVPLLALAGNLAAKRQIPASAGTFRTEGPTFVVLLIGTVLLVGALTFLPALAVGPIVEHFLMGAGQLF